jgi:hypothetical protein
MCHNDIDFSGFMTLIGPRRFSSHFALAVRAIWRNVSLAHRLTVWHKQRHDLHDDPRFAALVKKMGFSEAKP